MTYKTLKALFTAICDSVRRKEGSTAKIPHQELPERIDAIVSIDTSSATATAADIREGVTAFVDGEKVIGTLPVLSSSVVSFANEDISITKGTSNFMFKANTANEEIYPANKTIEFDVNLNRFGDAEPENVDYGITFTSKNGLKLTGKRAVEDNDTVVSNEIEATSLSNIHYWKKTTGTEDVTEEKVVDYQLSYSNSSLGNTFYGFTHYADEIDVVDDAITLVNPIERGTINEETLNGKYIQNGSNFYRIPTDATITTNSSAGATSYTTKTVDRVYKLTYIASGSVSYVVTNDNSDYPENGTQDGCTYLYQGTLKENTDSEICEVHSITITEEQNNTIVSLLTGNSFIAEHYADEGLFVSLINLGGVKDVSNRIGAIYQGNRPTVTNGSSSMYGACSYRYTYESNNTLQNLVIGTSLNDNNSTAVRLIADNSGNLSCYLTSSIYLPAGSYMIALVLVS